MTNRELLHSLDLFLRDHPEMLDEPVQVIDEFWKSTSKLLLFGNKTGALYVKDTYVKNKENLEDPL